jgi:hypothetical protein
MAVFQLQECEVIILLKRIIKIPLIVILVLRVKKLMKFLILKILIKMFLVIKTRRVLRRVLYNKLLIIALL